jgi:TatD DNase family protein
MNYSTHTFVDTHAHLYEDVFAEDRILMIERALKSGVHKIVIQNVDSTTIAGMKDLVHQFPQNCFATMGLHPCYVKENFEAELNIVKQHWASENFVAVGEIGLDYHWDKTFIEQQKQVFREQVKLAKQYSRPIIIHSRSAFYDCLKIVKEEQDGNLKGIFHCFGEGIREANEAIEAGMMLGIGGTVTYKNSGLQTVLPQLDLKHIVLETDAPYLPPVPHRGKRNESCYIPIIAQRVAEIKQMSIRDVANITTNNANELFGW